jgi:hypothetical protein
VCNRLLPRLVILGESEIYCTGNTAGLSKSIRELSGFQAGYFTSQMPRDAFDYGLEYWLLQSPTG